MNSHCGGGHLSICQTLGVPLLAWEARLVLWGLHKGLSRRGFCCLALRTLSLGSAQQSGGVSRATKPCWPCGFALQAGPVPQQLASSISCDNPRPREPGRRQAVLVTIPRVWAGYFYLPFTENGTLSPVVGGLLWPLQAGTFHTFHITCFSLWHSDWVPEWPR